MMTVKQDNISNKLDSMVKNARGFEQIWKRNLKSVYLKYQEKRWQTKNWGDWKELDQNSYYYKWKTGQNAKTKRSVLNKKGERLTKKKSIIEGGRTLMVATGELRKSILAKSGEYKEVVTDREALVYTTVPYAGGADKQRSFTKFDREFIQEMKRVLIKGLKL